MKSDQRTVPQIRWSLFDPLGSLLIKAALKEALVLSRVKMGRILFRPMSATSSDF
jgi:hypothetical protein